MNCHKPVLSSLRIQIYDSILNVLKLDIAMDVTGILLIVIQNDYKLRNNNYF